MFSLFDARKYFSFIQDLKLTQGPNFLCKLGNSLTQSLGLKNANFDARILKDLVLTKPRTLGIYSRKIKEPG